MVQHNRCISLKELGDLVTGRLDISKIDSMTEHLDNCSACLGLANTVISKDTYIDSLRDDASHSDCIAQAAPRMVIEELKRFPLAANLPESLTARTLDLADENAGNVVPLDFLAPAQEEGELGRLGSYRVLEVLGRGGMGMVVLAHDPSLDRMAALKVMLPDFAATASAKTRFLREARAAAKLKSDHIVSIFHVGEDRGVPFLAMELLKGNSLDRLLTKNVALHPQHILRIGIGVAKGLAIAHEKGLIHRDVKPSNIWLESDSTDGVLENFSRAKLLDFGVARVQKEDMNLTQSGAIVGTPAFMSPEQARGDTSLDSRTDLFSLGCVLYRLAVGRSPFHAETLLGTVMELAVRTPEAPDQLNPGIPRELSRLIMHLLEKDPQKRPFDATRVASRLEEIAKAMPADASHVSRPMAFQHRSWRFLPGFSVVCAAVMLTVIAAWGVFYWHTPDGTIRFEINDPEIRLGFGHGRAELTEADRDPIYVEPGDHALKISRGNFHFQAPSLRIDQRENVKIKIDWIDGKKLVISRNGKVLDEKVIEGEIVQTTFDQDREVVRIVQRLGGSVGLTSQNVFLDTARGDAIPDGPINVVGITLQDMKLLDSDLEHITQLNRLGTLSLARVGLTDSQMRFIAEAPNLAQVYLPQNPLTDKSVGALLKNRKLRALHLSDANLGDRAAPFFPQFPELHRLEIQNCGITDATLRELAKCKRLENLAITKNKVTPANVQALAAALPACSIEWDGGTIEPTDVDRRVARWVHRLGGNVGFNTSTKYCNTRNGDVIPETRIEVKGIDLGLIRQGLDDSDMKWIAKLPGLDTLIVAQTNLTAKGFSELMKSPSLVALYLGGLPLTDQDILPLRKFSLMRLHLDSTAITDESMPLLAHFEHLVDLNLFECKVTDNGIKLLARSKKLEFLGLKSTKVSETTVNALAEALPECRIEWDGGVVHPRTVDRYVARRIQKIGGEIGFFSNDGFKDTQRGDRLPEGQIEIMSINVALKKVFGDLEIKELPKLKALSTLVISGTSVTDEGCATLSDCERLEVLIASKLPWTDKAIAAIKNLSLIRLHIAETHVTGASLKVIGEYKRLSELDLGGCTVTDEGLKHLSRATELRQLNLRQCKVTKTGIRDLAASIPKCRIEWDGGVIESKK